MQTRERAHCACSVFLFIKKERKKKVPHEHVEGLFIKFYRKAVGSQPLLNLLEYVNTTWIRSEIWPPKAWCVFNRSVRTNNDVEGWHYRLNLKAHRGK